MVFVSGAIRLARLIVVLPKHGDVFARPIALGQRDGFALFELFAVRGHNPLSIGENARVGTNARKERQKRREYST
jgi:hypothetical protein